MAMQGAAAWRVYARLQPAEGKEGGIVHDIICNGNMSLAGYIASAKTLKGSSIAKSSSLCIAAAQVNKSQ